jgi:hypothetical protein
LGRGVAGFRRDGPLVQSCQCPSLVLTGGLVVLRLSNGIRRQGRTAWAVRGQCRRTAKP